MKKRTLVIIVLAVLSAAAAYAQTMGFFELVKTATPQQIQAAIDQGADLKARDSDGRTALMYAASNLNPEVISTLLKAGAVIKARDNNGWTPLMYAVANNKNPEVIGRLLKAGADIKAQSTTRTAVEIARPQRFAAFAAEHPRRQSLPVHEYLRMCPCP